MTSPLIVPIADALEAAWNAAGPDDVTRYSFLAEGQTAADACIAVIAALPADYTAVDVLAFLRGEDVPSEPLPAKEHRGDGPIPLVKVADVWPTVSWVNTVALALNDIHAATTDGAA